MKPSITTTVVSTETNAQTDKSTNAQTDIPSPPPNGEFLSPTTAGKEPTTATALSTVRARRCSFVSSATNNNNTTTVLRTASNCDAAISNNTSRNHNHNQNTATCCKTPNTCAPTTTRTTTLRMTSSCRAATSTSASPATASSAAPICCHIAPTEGVASQKSATADVAEKSSSGACRFRSSASRSAEKLLRFLLLFCFLCGDIRALPLIGSTGGRKRNHKSSPSDHKHKLCTSLCHGYYKMCDSSETRGWQGQFICYRSFQQCTKLCDRKYAEAVLGVRLDDRWRESGKVRTNGRADGRKRVEQASKPPVTAASTSPARTIVEVFPSRFSRRAYKIKLAEGDRRRRTRSIRWTDEGKLLSTITAADWLSSTAADSSAAGSSKQQERGSVMRVNRGSHNYREKLKAIHNRT